MKRFLVLFICACSSIVIHATNFYVSNNGNDGFAGSATNPWKTLNFSVQQLSAGDTLFVKPGIYNEYCTIIQQATSGNPIVITTEPGHEHEAVIDGSGVTILLNGIEEEQGGLIQMVNASHIHILSIAFENSPKEGVISYESSDIIMNNLYVKESQSSGIAAWNSLNITINNCKVENACLAQKHEYITIGGTSDFEVKNCIVQYSDLGSVKEGIDAKDGSNNGIIAYNTVKDLNAPGIYLDAWSDETAHIDVYNNLVFNCNGIALASEAGGHLHDVDIYNNISVDNINYGLVLGNWGDSVVPNRPISNINIYHNTFINNGSTGNWGGGISIENQDLSNLSITNNIICNNDSFQINNESNLANSLITTSGNLIFGDTLYATELTKAIEIYVDPQVDENNNFSLNTNSPAIDGANPNNQISFDFSNTNRPIDGNNDQIAISDIGAMEYNPSGMSVSVRQVDSFNVFPNPFQSKINIEGLDRNDSIEIYNISGVLVYSGHCETIATDGWINGIYILLLKQNNQIHNRKLLIK